MNRTGWLFAAVLVGCRAEPQNETAPGITTGASTDGDVDAGVSSGPAASTTTSDTRDTEGTASSHYATAACDPESAPTWTNFAEAFVFDHCVECHQTDDVFGDFRELEVVRAWGERIRCGVAPGPIPDCPNGPFPRRFPNGNGPGPSDADRLKVVAWVDAGMPR